MDLNSVKLLSGKELVQYGGKKSDSYIPIKGPKQSVPNGSWLEKKQVESSLEAKKALIGDQRIEKRGSLSVAEWIESKQKAVVSEKRGSHWLHIGHSEDEILYIYPEEILYLLEMNCLILTYGQVPVSIQQAYTIIIGRSLSLNQYRVYCSLSKQGYKLVRYNPDRKYADGEAGHDDMNNYCRKKSVHETQVSDDEQEKEETTLPEISKISEEKSLLIDSTNSIAASEEIKIIDLELSESNTDSTALIDVNIKSVSEENTKKVSKKHLENNDDASVSKIVNYDSGLGDGDIDVSANSAEKNNDILDSSNKKAECNTPINDPSGIDKTKYKNVAEGIVLSSDGKNRYSENGSKAARAYDRNNSPKPSTSKSYYTSHNTFNSEGKSSNYSNPDCSDMEFSEDDGPSIGVEKKSNNNRYMINQDSSDDCMVISDDEDKDSSSSDGMDQRRTVNLKNKAKNNKDIFEVEFSESDDAIAKKVKILQSIVNCYRRDIVFIEASDKKYLPINTQFSKEKYVVHLKNLTNKYNRDVDVPTPFNNSYSEDTRFGYGRTYRPITNFGNESMGRVSNGGQFFNQPFMQANNFANNNYFWNHIYEQLILRQLCTRNGQIYTPDLQPRTPYFSDNYFIQGPFRRSHDNCYRNPAHYVVENPNGNQYQPTRNEPNTSNNTRINPYAHANRERIAKHRPERIEKRKKHVSTNALLCDIEDDDDSDSDSSIPRVTALRQIRALILRFHSITKNFRTTHIVRNALESLVKNYNLKYKQNFKLNLQSPQAFTKKIINRKRKSSEQYARTDPKVKIVQLSSDSDDFENERDRVIRENIEKIRRRTRRELNYNKSSCSPQFRVNSFSSQSNSDATKNKNENFIAGPKSNASYSLKAPESTSQYEPKRNGGEACRDSDKMMKIFGNWIHTWNKPEVSNKKPKNSIASLSNVNILMAFVNNIKEMSYSKESSINSWRQAKKLYESRNTVYISDDDIGMSFKPDSRLGDLTTVKIKETHPLVRPQDCKSVETVLTRLQIFQPVPSPKSASEPIKISYDLYMPNFKTFRKSDPPYPTYSIIILSNTSPIPTAADLQRIGLRLPDCVAFLFAIVAVDTISFIQMECVDIPCLTGGSSL